MSTLGLEPEHFLLTTGTFNLVFKDRIAIRLSGAHSVQRNFGVPDGSETYAFHTSNFSVLETL